MENSALIKIFGGDDRLDDLLQEVLAQLFQSDGLIMLSRDDNCVHADGDGSTLDVLVLHCYLQHKEPRET